MSPDRVIVMEDWIRWKHRRTVWELLLGLVAVMAVVMGFWAVGVSSSVRAERLARDTQIQEEFSAANRALIISNCQAVEAFKAGLKGWFFEDLGAGAPPERIAEAQASYDRRFPPKDCEAP